MLLVVAIFRRIKLYIINPYGYCKLIHDVAMATKKRKREKRGKKKDIGVAFFPNGENSRKFFSTCTRPPTTKVLILLQVLVKPPPSSLACVCLQLRSKVVSHCVWPSHYCLYDYCFMTLSEATINNRIRISLPQLLALRPRNSLVSPFQRKTLKFSQPERLGGATAK